jgi:hypothetical protein
MDTMSDKSLRITIVVLFLLLLFTIATLNKATTKIDQQNVEIKSMQDKLDSLHDENFNNQVMNGRYELSIEHLKEINPKAAEELTDFLEHETE